MNGHTFINDIHPRLLSLTFADDSQLSVTGKIKQYFEYQEKQRPANLDSSISSSSSGSIDTDVSFQKELAAWKLELTTRNPATVSSSVRQDNKRKTINLISFDDLSEDIEMINGIRTPPKAHLIDNSFNNLVINDSWRKISDDTFERDEALCASIIQDDADETQIFDVEAPSSLWDQSIYPMEESVTKLKSNCRRLPSTIPEESTINSETSTESTLYQPDAVTKNAHKCVLLKPIVLPSKGAPKIKSISSSNESNVQPTTTKSYYRPSLMNEFPVPAKKKRNFFFTEDAAETKLQSKNTKAPVHQMLSPIEKNFAVSKDASHSNNQPLLTSPIQKYIRKPPAEPFELFTYPENKPASPLNDENTSTTSSNQFSPVQPDFNDTIEAVEFFMEKGKELQAMQFIDNLSIAHCIPPAPTAPLSLFSPKSNNSRPPDTIRRRLLIRNFESTVNEAASPTGTRNPLEPQRISDLQLMTRRSVNKSPNDSYLD